MPGADAAALKRLIGLMGTVERLAFLPVVRRILAEDEPRLDALDRQMDPEEQDHDHRELAELVTRFRHVRSQSVAVLDAVKDEQWARRAHLGEQGVVTLADVVELWLDQDDRAFDQLTASLSRLV